MDDLASTTATAPTAPGKDTASSSPIAQPPRKGGAGRAVPITRRIVALIVALTLPVTAFGAFVLIQQSLSEQSRYAREATQIAAFVSRLVDNELTNLASLLRGASYSTSLQVGDLAAFHAEAARLVAGRDQIIVLRDLDGRQLVNTAAPYGAALPGAVPITAEERAAFEAGLVVVGGVYASPLSGELRVPVALPLSPQGQLLVLAITVPVQHFFEVIRPAVPQGWILTLGDARGTIIARSEDNSKYAGQPALPQYLELARGDGGSFRIRGFGGRELLSGYARSSFSGWLTGANIPIDIVEQPLWRDLTAIIAVAAIAAVLAAVISGAFIRQFGRASTTLLEAVRVPAGRAAAPSSSTGLQEFDRVLDALATARGEQARAEKSLRARSQELEAVLDTAPAAVWFTRDPEVNEVSRNAHAAALMRVSVEDHTPLGSGRLKHVQVLRNGEPCARSDLPLQRAIGGDEVRDEEYVFRFSDGSEAILLTSARALRDQAGKVRGAVSVSVDISARKQAEMQQHLLNNELNHRVKNTLTTVLSIATRSIRTASSLKEAEQALSARLMAIAGAYDVLTRELWQGANLLQLLEQTTTGYARSGDRIRFSGPAFRLSPANSLTVSLIAHELAVNATKYGALSVDAGRVECSWTVDTGPQGRLLTLVWRESGGPPVAPPHKTGFGTDLLSRLSQSSGTQYSVSYDPDGLVCTWTVAQA